MVIRGVMNRYFKTLGALFAIALLSGSLTAAAQTRKDVREERKEVREERKELREDRKELREDRKAGASAEEIKEGKKELAEDRKDIREERKEVREERREARKARQRELKEKWGDAVKKPAAQAELRQHGRRAARLQRAKAVADKMGKKELVARIDKLLEKEKARHQVAMEKIKEEGAKP